jgi:DNA-binding XRE family transcriptional regulator
MNWPHALKEYRRRHALTQAALAEILNLDPTTVSRWERGRDQPALGIQRRLRSLVMPAASDVERVLRVLIDTSAEIAILLDYKYRLVHSSAKHRELLRLDASELYGKSFQRIQTQSHIAMLESIGGPKGWWRNGVTKTEFSLLRKPFERARNPQASAQRGTAWSIRDGVETPYIIGITREIPTDQYDPRHFRFTTLDDPVT